MAVPFVQAASATASTGTGLAVSFGSNASVDSLVVAAVTKNTGTNDSMADDVGASTWVDDIIEVENTDHGTALFSAVVVDGMITVSAGGISSSRAMAIAEYNQIVTASPFDKSQNGTGFGTAMDSGLTLTTAQARELLVGVHGAGNSAANPVAHDSGGGWNERADIVSTANKVLMLQDKEATSTGTFKSIATGAGSANWVALIGTYKLTGGASFPLEQEGFRWRNDDGSEATATWKAAQDTNVTAVADQIARLRMIVNAAGDQPSKQFKLQYRKVGDPSWRDIDRTG